MSDQKKQKELLRGHLLALLAQPAPDKHSRDDETDDGEEGLTEEDREDIQAILKNIEESLADDTQEIVEEWSAEDQRLHSQHGQRRIAHVPSNTPASVDMQLQALSLDEREEEAEKAPPTLPPSASSRPPAPSGPWKSDRVVVRAKKSQ